MQSAQANLRFRNTFGFKLFRNNNLYLPSDFSERTNKGLILPIIDFSCLNAVVTQGKNDILDVQFGNITQKTIWYFGLINNSPTPTLLDADTLASHTGWVEWTGYTGNRKEWVDAAAASGSKGTTSLASFTINASGTLYGAFLASVDTGTAGILWATTQFPDPVPVVNNDIIKLNYTISILTE